MLSQLALLLLDMIVQPFVAILLLRFHLQWLRAPMRNPLGEFIMTITNFVVLRTRKYIPAVWKLDTATLLLAYIGELIYLLLLMTAQGVIASNGVFPGILLLALFKLLTLSVYLLMIVVLVQAVLSWVNPHTPIAPMINAISDPFLSPIRRVVPLIGRVDLSALVLFIICNIVLIPLRHLENMALGMMMLPSISA